MVPGLEMKFAGGPPVLTDGQVIEGYASLFGLTDQGGDAVLPGAFAASLARIARPDPSGSGTRSERTARAYGSRAACCPTWRRPARRRR